MSRSLFNAFWVVLALGATAAPVQAQSGPSFSCSAAETATEFAICGDQILSRLDRQMAAIYQQAVARNDSVRQSQRRWLAARNRCGNNRSCLANLYSTRIAELNAVVGQPTVVPDRLSRSEVGRMQAALSVLGYYGGAVDSLTGPQTNAAVAAFRRAEGGSAQTMDLAELLRLAEARAAAVRVVVIDDPVVVEPIPEPVVVEPVVEPEPVDVMTLVSQKVWSGVQVCPGGAFGLERSALDLQVTLEATSTGELRASVGNMRAATAHLQTLPGDIELLSVEPEGRCPIVFANLAPLADMPLVASGDFGLNAFCDAMLPLVAASAQGQREAAMALTLEQPTMMRDYDIETGVLTSMLTSPRVAQALGAPYSQLPYPSRAAMFERLRLCAILGANEASRAELDALLHASWDRAAFNAWAQIGDDGRGTIAPLMTFTAFDGAIGLAGQAEQILSSWLNELKSERITYSSPEFLSAAIAERRSLIYAIAPTSATVLLSDLDDYRDTLIRSLDDFAGGPDETVVPTGFDGADLPNAARDAPFGELLTRLSAPEGQEMSDTDLLALAVMSGDLIQRCDLPRDPADRLALRTLSEARLYQGGTTSGIIGGTAGGTTMTSEQGSRIINDAAQTVQALPCEAPSTRGVAQAILDVLIAQQTSSFR